MNEEEKDSVLSGGVQASDATLDFPDGGLRAWLVIVGVSQRFATCHVLLIILPIDMLRDVFDVTQFKNLYSNND